MGGQAGHHCRAQAGGHGSLVGRLRCSSSSTQTNPCLLAHGCCLQEGARISGHAGCAGGALLAPGKPLGMGMSMGMGCCCCRGRAGVLAAVQGFIRLAALPIRCCPTCATAPANAMCRARRRRRSRSGSLLATASPRAAPNTQTRTGCPASGGGPGAAASACACAVQEQQNQTARAPAWAALAAYLPAPCRADARPPAPCMTDARLPACPPPCLPCCLQALAAHHVPIHQRFPSPAQQPQPQRRRRRGGGRAPGGCGAGRVPRVSVGESGAFYYERSKCPMAPLKIESHSIAPFRNRLRLDCRQHMPFVSRLVLHNNAGARQAPARLRAAFWFTCDFAWAGKQAYDRGVAQAGKGHEAGAVV